MPVSCRWDLALTVGGCQVFLLHGANFLTLRLEGELRERARRAVIEVRRGRLVTDLLLELRMAVVELAGHPVKGEVRRREL